MNGSSGEPVSEARASFVDLVVNPRAFFEALDPKPVNLLFPGLIVLVTGVIGERRIIL